MRFLTSLPLLFVLAVLVLCLGIWEATGLTGKDEFYLGLRTPLEMLHDDHWLVPFLDGVPRIKKPPLLYWLGRASYELFGASLVSARMLVVLFGGLLVVATAAIGRRLSGERTTGTVAALILLGMLGLATESRRFMLDIPVAALSASAFWLLLIWSERPRWPWLSGASLLLAAAFLIKGPIAVIVCGSGLLALLIGHQLQGASPASLARAGAYLATGAREQAQALLPAMSRMQLQHASSEALATLLRVLALLTAACAALLHLLLRKRKDALVGRTA